MTWDWWTTNNIDLDKMKYFWRGNVSGVCQISCTHVYKAAVFFVFLILSFGTGFLSWSKSNIELRSDDTTILNSEWQNKSQWKKLASIQGGRMKFWWYNRSEKSSSICRHSTQKKRTQKVSQGFTVCGVLCANCWARSNPRRQPDPFLYFFLTRCRG